MNTQALLFLMTLSGASDAGTPTLYERLGGKPALGAVLDEFVNRIIADGEVNHSFRHAVATPESLASYKAKPLDLVCHLSGGPCKVSTQASIWSRP